jgi:hypothetical protein
VQDDLRTEYQVILNPRLSDIPEESGLREGYTGDRGQRTDVGRRVLPDTAPPSSDGTPARAAPIIAPSDGVFVLDDIAGTTGDTIADQGKPILVPLALRAVLGKVRVETAPNTFTPVVGARVTLRRTTGSPSVVGTATSRQPDGGFTISDVPFGSNYRLSAVKAFGTRTPSTPGLPATVTSATFATEKSRDTTAPTLTLRIRNLSGTVLFNNAPRANATVQLLVGTQVRDTTTTNASGVFTFTGVPAGTYNFVARVVNGGTTTEGSDHQGGDAFGLNACHCQLGQINVVQRSLSGTVSRRVRTASGALTSAVALANAQVELYKASDFALSPNNPSTSLRVATVQANAAGEYNFQSLRESGDYVVRVTAPSGAVGISRITVGNSTNNTSNVIVFETRIFGTVTLNGTARSGVTVTLLRGTTTLGTTTTDGAGAFSFENTVGTGFGAGSYTVRASLTLGGRNFTDQATATVTDNKATPEVSDDNVLQAPVTLALFSQTVSGTVTRDGVGIAATVQLFSGSTLLATVTSSANGSFTFSNVVSGTYTARATAGSRSGSKTFTVENNGQTVDIGTIELSGSTVSETFTAGNSYLISVAYADTTALDATTTVAKAFSRLPTVGSQVNYRLFRFNAATQSYSTQLAASDTIRRGEGFLLQVVTGSVGIVRPVNDATRRPLAATVSQFTIPLRRGQNAQGTRGGLNLIGFPLNPRAFDEISFWAVPSPTHSMASPEPSRFRLRRSVVCSVRWCALRTETTWSTRKLWCPIPATS